MIMPLMDIGVSTCHVLVGEIDSHSDSDECETFLLEVTI
jgi:hypothetical protein